MPMTPKQRQKLKADAHKLKPIVYIGYQGLTVAVNKEIDRGLNDHELIKMRIQNDDREVRRQWFAEICKTHGAELIQQIGCVGVLYRKNPD
jgi:RNA-binding protein